MIKYTVSVGRTNTHILAISSNFSLITAPIMYFLNFKTLKTAQGWAPRPVFGVRSVLDGYLVN